MERTGVLLPSYIPWYIYLGVKARAPHFTPQHWLLCHVELY